MQPPLPEEIVLSKNEQLLQARKQNRLGDLTQEGSRGLPILGSNAWFEVVGSHWWLKIWENFEPPLRWGKLETAYRVHFCHSTNMLLTIINFFISFLIPIQQKLQGGKTCIKSSAVLIFNFCFLSKQNSKNIQLKQLICISHFVIYISLINLSY